MVGMSGYPMSSWFCFSTTQKQKKRYMRTNIKLIVRGEGERLSVLIVLDKTIVNAGKVSMQYRKEKVNPPYTYGNLITSGASGSLPSAYKHYYCWCVLFPSNMKQENI
jgi:hypothetical protein